MQSRCFVVPPQHDKYQDFIQMLDATGANLMKSITSKHSPRTLILATSYAPELRSPELRPKIFPRTDYVELAKLLGSEIIDYAIYDDSPALLSRARALEKKLRLDFHLALTGLRKSKDFDVVMLMSERVAIPYMLMQRLTRRRARTVYVSAHSSRKQAGLIKSMGLFKNLDIAVSNTYAQRDFFVNDMGIAEDRIRYVLYAADERFFTPGPGDDSYIFSAGGIRGRDYETLFKAVAELPVKVRVAAGGRAYGPDARKRLPSIPPNVEMLPPTDSAGMLERYRNASLVVVPLSRDRMDAAGCSVVLEGMACGRPVIACRTRGMEDYISDGMTGRLVECEDPSALSDAMSAALERAEDRERWSRAARAESEGRLSLTRLVQGLAQSAYDARGKTYAPKNL
ncbi:MAG: glycosyltransferase family 4 protein [Armatimonadetes bacterium]|nr:glycosyltransferase family 4 protein [Armatimonadota bacterium]